MLAAIRSRRGFSLIELVIVVLILGIIAAIAVPRMSRGARGAQDSSVASDLAVLRSAIDMYHSEHGSFPVASKFVGQLTTYTDDAGGPSATADATHIYGPYLRAVPALPVGTEKGSTGVAAAAAAGIGWLYNETTGVITANSGAATDTAGKLYTSY
jgi:type II secretion system protein G